MNVTFETTQAQRETLSPGWELLISLFQERLPQARMFRYSCPRCFETLWSMLLDDESNKAACNCMGSSDEFNENVIVIAYDGSPAAYTRPESVPGIHLDSIFSPAALFTLLAKKSAQSAGCKQPRWIVIDPHQRTRANQDTLAISHALTPHFQLIDGSETNLLSTIDRAQRVLPWDELKAETAEAYLKLIVTAPGNRHAVSNVVGPVLLGFAPEEPEMKWVVSHLRYVLSAIGLAPANERAGLTLPEDLRQRLSALGSTEFVLIDDQHRNGWGQLVKVALGADRAEELSSSTDHRKPAVAVSLHDSADFLLAQVETALKAEHTLSSRLTIGERNCDNEVLLLDLCLYQGAPLNVEARFFLRVLVLAEQLRHLHGVAWSGFSDAELSRLKTWLEEAVAGNSDRTDNIYREALTLLPRVLSLADPSLPIVIFSSFGQTEIANRLSGYRNIIIDFEKPRLSDSPPPDLVAQTASSFFLAITHAVSSCRRSLARSAVA